MLGHNSEWQLTVCNNGCITDIYFTDGDTSYNNYSYKILNGYHYISRTFWLRENTQTEKVYLSFLQNNNRKEVLLYDFDLQKGDSTEINNPISPFVSNPGYYIVDSIENIQLNDGLFYDHFYLSSLSQLVNESAVWIEGIGSLSLINAPGGTPDVNGSGKLSCYFNDGNLVYSQLDSISPIQSLIIGLAQCLALIPGTSRSGITISAGLALGVESKVASRFSFLLAIPTIGAIACYQIISVDFASFAAEYRRRN